MLVSSTNFHRLSSIPYPFTRDLYMGVYKLTLSFVFRRNAMPRIPTPARHTDRQPIFSSRKRVSRMSNPPARATAVKN